MGRSFNIEVFRKVINTGATYYSDPQYDELLGSADIVVLQAIVDATPGAATVTAQYQTSNDGGPVANVWHDPGNFPASPAPASSADVPKSAMTRNASTDPLANRGRVAVSTSAQNGVMVRVIVCGRASSREGR